MKQSGSLRVRLLAYAAVVIIVALVATGLAISELFERYAQRRIGQELDTHIAQLAGGMRFDENGTPSLARHPSDPRFNRVFGGLYWQVTEAGKDVLLRSRSLWDSELALPEDSLKSGEIHIHTQKGPAGGKILAHETSIIVPTNQGERTLHLSVAVDTRELESLTTGFSHDLVPALGLLGLVLLVGFYLQISAGLKPMVRLRQGVTSIRAGERNRLVGPAPKEVLPLVEEVNALLDLHEKDMVRARDRAADLAHGLKTPLTALTADIARLREKGETKLADDIDELAGRMHRHLDREMARARYRARRSKSAVALLPVIHALVRTLERTPQGEGLDFTCTIPAELKVSVDADDLYDIFGNLLENATRHASSQIHISAKENASGISVFIDDDGPGLSEEQAQTVRQRGQRLDTTGGGAGLGLAIVSEIMEANDAILEFSGAPNGGLRVICRFKGINH